MSDFFKLNLAGIAHSITMDTSLTGLEKVQQGLDIPIFLYCSSSSVARLHRLASSNVQICRTSGVRDLTRRSLYV
jgi:hypothetical protein